MSRVLYPSGSGTAAELRRAFDEAFALPPSREEAEAVDLLAIRVAGDPYVIHLREIAALVKGRKVVPIPAVTPDLLGLAGIRGGVVSVFGLTSLLGYGHAPDPQRWMVLCGAEEPIALAFSDLEGHLRLPRSALHADENLRATRQYLSEIANTEAGARPVIDVSLVVRTIRNRVGRQRPAKEQ